MSLVLGDERREFFRLAAAWLGCQWQMTHSAALPAMQRGPYDPAGAMVGWRDNRAEMALLLAMARKSVTRGRVHATR